MPRGELLAAHNSKNFASLSPGIFVTPLHWLFGPWGGVRICAVSGVMISVSFHAVLRLSRSNIGYNVLNQFWPIIVLAQDQYSGPCKPPFPSDLHSLLAKGKTLHLQLSVEYKSF